MLSVNFWDYLIVKDALPEIVRTRESHLCQR